MEDLFDWAFGLFLIGDIIAIVACAVAGIWLAAIFFLFVLFFLLN